ncbi:hypothetical protein HNQ92_000333 [Rhabdobacter roseus]|uniref:Uncharacterized protein n=1 Tax=Rhabdobacter roseus TaxID=1655419 RepID=A0A840TKX3_9BACT|nr:hypothetical protein [Rhabdobacter roseus]
MHQAGHSGYTLITIYLGKFAKYLCLWVIIFNFAILKAKIQRIIHIT